MLLLNNVGGLDTFFDVGDGFFLSTISFFLSILDLRSHLGDHGGRFGDPAGLLNFRLGLSLDDFLGLSDLGSDAGQLFLQSLNLGGL